MKRETESPWLRHHTASIETLLPFIERYALYAVVDACDAPKVQERIASCDKIEFVSLYAMRAEEELAEIAPYLALVDVDLLAWICDELLPEPWGILVVAQESPENVRRHLRQFLIVCEEENKKNEMYFRFYDPRVLARFLPTCQPGQLDLLFGPVQSYGVLDPETADVTLFSSIS